MKIETLSEEMRVLYVALTRAKEKYNNRISKKRDKIKCWKMSKIWWVKYNVIIKSQIIFRLDYISTFILWTNNGKSCYMKVLQKEDVIKMCATQEPEKMGKLMKF